MYLRFMIGRKYTEKQIRWRKTEENHKTTEQEA